MDVVMRSEGIARILLIRTKNVLIGEIHVEIIPT